MLVASTRHQLRRGPNRVAHRSFQHCSQGSGQLGTGSPAWVKCNLIPGAHALSADAVPTLTALRVPAIIRTLVGTTYDDQLVRKNSLSYDIGPATD